jgi:hypothetical protein
MAWDGNVAFSCSDYQFKEVQTGCQPARLAASEAFLFVGGWLPGFSRQASGLPPLSSHIVVPPGVPPTRSCMGWQLAGHGSHDHLNERGQLHKLPQDETIIGFSFFAQ